MKLVRVRLVRKLADKLDGVDLSARSIGETFSLPPALARLLIAEGWAVKVQLKESRRPTPLSKST